MERSSRSAIGIPCRLCVCLSVKHLHFSPEPLGRLTPNLGLGFGGTSWLDFVQMGVVPHHGAPGWGVLWNIWKNLLLLNRLVDRHQTWWVTLRTLGDLKLYKEKGYLKKKHFSRIFFSAGNLKNFQFFEPLNRQTWNALGIFGGTFRCNIVKMVGIAPGVGLWGRVFVMTNFPTLGPSKLYSIIDGFSTSNIIGPLSQTEKSCRYPFRAPLNLSGFGGKIWSRHYSCWDIVYISSERKQLKSNKTVILIDGSWHQGGRRD